MSNFEQALIRNEGARIQTGKALALIEREASKGCAPDVSVKPLALEPVFTPLYLRKQSQYLEARHDWVFEEPPSLEELVRLQIWISPKQKLDWQRSELFLKQLGDLSHRVAMEIYGNKDRITLQFLCHRMDIAILRAAFEGQFEQCALSEKENGSEIFSFKKKSRCAFADFFPPPPYSHLFTQSPELQVSPYETLIVTLSNLPTWAIGFSQALFQPVSENHFWHRNVEMLLDLEYRYQILSGNATARQYPQQEPSYALTQRSRDLESKAHNDKPFFSAAWRIGLVSEKETECLPALFACAGNFLHGGRRLCRLDQNAYAGTASRAQEMFNLGLVYRPGFLVNSSECSGLIHVPPSCIFENRSISMAKLETLSSKTESPDEGILLGMCEVAGELKPVCVPNELRKRSIHIIGRHGTGKSTVMKRIAHQDILNETGCAVLDPHGDLIEALLRIVPENQLDRIIYFNPANPDYVPIWNPLQNVSRGDPSRHADNLVGAIKSVVDGWGDRLETILRYAFLSILSIDNPTLFDVSEIIRRDSEDGKRLREQVISIAENESVRRFWKEDFKTYQKSELTPPQHKLSKLLASGAYGEMLSQPDSLIDFRSIMDDGKVLLMDLSGLGSETREILGSFVLAVFHSTILARSALPANQRRPFYIFCDEAHRFVTDALQDLLTETRKYEIGLVLGHQYLSQFETKKRDALASVGTTIIYNLDTKDAAYLRKDLQEKVDLKDIINLERGEAIARIDREIIRLKTLPPLPPLQNHFRDRIIEESHRRYYRTMPELRASKQGRHKLSQYSPMPLTNRDEEEFIQK